MFRVIVWMKQEILVTRSNLEDKTTLMMELKNKVDELALHNEYQLRLKDMNYSEKIKVRFANLFFVRKWPWRALVNGQCVAVYSSTHIIVCSIVVIGCLSHQRFPGNYGEIYARSRAKQEQV